MRAKLGLFLVGLTVVVSAATLSIARIEGHGYVCRRDVVPCEATWDAWGTPASALAALAVVAGFGLAALWWRNEGPRLLAATALVALLAGALAAVVGGWYGRMLTCERTPGGACTWFWEPWGPPLAAAGAVLAAGGAAVASMAWRDLARPDA